MRSSLASLVGFVIMFMFIMLQFAVPKEAQFPLGITGALIAGAVIGTLTKDLHKGILGAFISAFLATIGGTAIGYVAFYATSQGAYGAGLFFWFLIGLGVGLLVGLLTGIVAMVGSIVGVFATRKKPPPTVQSTQPS